MSVSEGERERSDAIGILNVCMCVAFSSGSEVLAVTKVRLGRVTLKATFCLIGAIAHKTRIGKAKKAKKR